MSTWTCFNGLYLVKKSASRADTSASGSGIKKENISNKKLAEELSKTTIRKFEKSTFNFYRNIWEADLADMQLISKFNKIIRFLLC